jgi:hypothetical protein
MEIFYAGPQRVHRSDFGRQLGDGICGVLAHGRIFPNCLYRNVGEKLFDFVRFCADGWCQFLLLVCVGSADCASCDFE